MSRAIAVLPHCAPSGMLHGDLYSHSKNLIFFKLLRLSHDPLRGYIHKLEVRASKKRDILDYFNGTKRLKTIFYNDIIYDGF
jgi:hypothetical protein